MTRVHTLDQASADRFRRDFALVSRQRKGKAALAVSGGPDSLALLLLARATLDDVEAATVDHGLRPEAASEARFVGDVCRKLGIRHSILTLPEPPKGNKSAWARRRRYEVLEHWANQIGATTISTAHHADDQLETMLMRLNRGAGVGGMAGIRPWRGRIIRPLLTWRKEELEQIVREAGIAPVDDPSNHDDRYDRARLRKELRHATWLSPAGAVRAGLALASADSALEWAALDYMSRRAAQAGGIISLDPKGLPGEILRRILLECLRRIVPDAAPRADEIDRLLTSLRAGKTATLAEVKCAGGDFWTFQKAPPRRNI
jgi:tRNA(Ile)-lysidine synthase